MQVAEASTSATFTVPAQPLAFGEHLRLVGSAHELGGWDPESGLALEWGEGDNWSAEALLPAGAVEFKVTMFADSIELKVLQVQNVRSVLRTFSSCEVWWYANRLHCTGCSCCAKPIG